MAVELNISLTCCQRPRRISDFAYIDLLATYCSIFYVVAMSQWQSLARRRWFKSVLCCRQQLFDTTIRPTRLARNGAQQDSLTNLSS